MKNVIYLFTNKINQKKYVGQSIDFNVRLSAHKQQAKKDEYPLYRAIRKYGWDNFSIDIIFNCESEKQLNEMESYYIKMFGTLAPNGYNLTTGGDSNYTVSAESRKKMSDASKGRPAWNKGKKTGPISFKQDRSSTFKPIKATFPNGQIKIYKSAAETKIDGFNPSGVCLCCKYPFTYKTHKKVKWEYVDNTHIKEFEPKIKQFNSGAFIRGQISITAKKVKITDLKTNTSLIFESTSLAAKHYNYKQYNTISKYCKDNKIVNNLKFEFLDNVKETI